MAPWSKTIITGASLVLLAAPGCLASAQAADLPSGVEIKTTLEPTMFPTSWRSKEIAAAAEELDKAEARRSVACVSAAMALYPPAILKQNLKGVYLVKSMEFYGVKYGGTNSFDRVYIANRGALEGYSDAYIFGAFHHEFSSILLRNYGQHFNESEWRTANRPGTEYGKGGLDAIKGGTADTSFKAGFNVDGFLSQYGTASVEEDFNTFAEALFSGDRTFWMLCERYPRLQKKKDLAVAFYASVDSAFNEDFFRGLTKK